MTHVTQWRTLLLSLSLWATWEDCSFRWGRDWLQECDWWAPVPIEGSKIRIAPVGCWLPVSLCWVSASNHQLGFLLREPSHLGAGFICSCSGELSISGNSASDVWHAFQQTWITSPNISAHVPSHSSARSHPRLEFQTGWKANFSLGSSLV